MLERAGSTDVLECLAVDRYVPPTVAFQALQWLPLVLLCIDLLLTYKEAMS